MEPRQRSETQSRTHACCCLVFDSIWLCNLQHVYMWHMIRFVTISQNMMYASARNNSIAWSPWLDWSQLQDSWAGTTSYLCAVCNFDDGFWDSMLRSHVKVTCLPLVLKTWYHVRKIPYASSSPTATYSFSFILIFQYICQTGV